MQGPELTAVERIVDNSTFPVDVNGDKRPGGCGPRNHKVSVHSGAPAPDAGVHILSTGKTPGAARFPSVIHSIHRSY